jgi:O-acetylhomoserine/O-acetylserine sulfhydrylase-like pyridoxal-dependent enzyme
MRDETLALHAGFDACPAFKAVAKPICQTAACHIGIEHKDEIIADLGQVLAAATRGRVWTVP